MLTLHLLTVLVKDVKRKNSVFIKLPLIFLNRILTIFHADLG